MKIQQSIEPRTSFEGNLASRKKIMFFLEAFAWLPIANFASLNRQHPVPYLSTITGLSDSRILQGRLDQLRSSKMKEVQEHAKAYSRKEALRCGWTGEEYDAHVAASPRMSNGLPGTYSTWIHAFDQPELSLSHTKAIALRLDELICASLDAATSDDIRALTGHWVDFVLTVPGREQRFSQEAIEKQNAEVLAWRGATSWEDVAPLLDKQLLDLFWDLFAGFDAEWTSKCLPRMASAPILLWIAPRINEKFVFGSIPKKHRNFIYRPVRRLLELSHALVHRRFIGEWPEKPAGRMALSEVLDMPDHTIGNYFDGTRHLGMADYRTYWNKMVQVFSEKTGQPSPESWYPCHLAAVAILWQDTLIEATNELKFRSAVHPDEDDYRRIWEGYRRLWNITTEPDSLVWPEWLLKQHVMPNSVPTPPYTA